MKKQGKLVITRIKEYVFSLLYDNNNKLIQVGCDGGEKNNLNNIYIGRVNNLMPNINAAFIEYSKGQMGYYPISKGDEPVFVDLERAPGPLRVGDEVIVQIVKESVGNKEPVLSSEITFTGKYVVFSLKKRGILFSNKIHWPEFKESVQTRYEKLGYQDFGFIVRTNAMHAGIESLFEEIEFFRNLWIATSDLRIYRKCFSLLYQAPSSYISSIRDGYHNEVGWIVTDDEAIYQEIADYLEVYQPEDVHKLKLHDGSVTTLKTLYNIDRDIERVLNEKVWLKSGGYLIIQPTEALVSIDVNSGKYVSKKEAQKEYLKINLEAAEEIAHQLRLRNLSGIIIVDFINMKSEENKETLLKAFENAVLQDPIRTTIVDMTKLNLVELTRKKARRPLHELVNKSILLK
ncbi:MAG: ribonuclease E/G [Parasporobacterium sp.]|nr:ribonuclease E/G [Parasporobacterium sp.]